jgi:Tfp pilus assembly pilus retraction ATPase PilT
MYAPEEQPSTRRSLSESLVGVIAQGLIRTNDDNRAAYHDILVNTDVYRDYIRQGSLMILEESCRSADSTAWTYPINHFKGFLKWDASTQTALLE